MSDSHRELLPAAGAARADQESNSSISTIFPHGVHLTKRKRIGTQLACNACRKKRSRCNGERPKCAACRERSVECVYADKLDREMTEQSHKVLDVLQSVPESQAHAILRTLREGGDVSTILQGASAGKATERGSSTQAPTPARKQYPGIEFELSMSNPVSYPMLRCVTTSALQGSNILRPFPVRRNMSSYQKSPSDELMVNSEVGLSKEPPGRSRSLSDPSINPFLMRGVPEATPLKPDYCDTRLQHLNIGFWTSVSIPSELTARVISLYLETDHPLLGTFDPDLFVSDLVDWRSTFCSKFLVNAVLYWGCQMYSSFDPRASQYIQQFGTEAESLWKEEGSQDSILNLAGLHLLSLGYLGNGKDHHVLKYTALASRMGSRMGLFGADPSVATEKFQDLPQELRRPTAYAAWGTFNWIVLMSLFYQQPGLEYPEHPPGVPIPGLSDDQLPQSSDTSDRSTPNNTKSVNAHYMGDTFPALCQFWKILHGVTLQYYKHGRPPHDDLGSLTSIEFAEYKFRELIAWVETLPARLAHSEDSPHHVIIFHIWLHAAVLDIFRPFARQRNEQSIRLKTFSSRDSTAHAVFMASLNQLKQLILVYRSKYVSSAYTMLWHTGLTYVANAVLLDTSDSEWRFYFLLCIHGYESLRRSYRFAEAIGRGLLSMTLRNGDISGGEARKMLQELRGPALNEGSGPIRATFMADLDLALTNPDEATAENLADRFESLALFEELINPKGNDTMGPTLN